MIKGALMVRLIILIFIFVKMMTIKRNLEGRIKKCTYLGNCVLLLLFLRIIKRRFNPVLKLCEKTGNFVGIGTYDGREREDYCSTIL